MTEDKWSRWLTQERWPAQRAMLEAALNAVRDRILRMAEVKPGERVVDLGSGTGLLGHRAAELVAADGVVVYLDISGPALSAATTAAGTHCRQLFLIGDAQAIPLSNDSADAVVMRSVLCFVRDRQAAGREIARVLRPGGRMATYEPINRKMPTIVDLPEFEDVSAAYRRGRDINPLCDFEEADLVTTFRDAGFRTVELEMDESRMPVRGPEWVHGFRHGAPPGYSGYDMLLAAGISRNAQTSSWQRGNVTWAKRGQ